VAAEPGIRRRARPVRVGTPVRHCRTVALWRCGAVALWHCSTVDSAITSIGTIGPPNLAGFWSIVVLLPSLAVTVRRLRDAGRRWTKLFWILLPIAGAIVLIVHLSEPTKPADAPTPPAVAQPSPAP
jgi:Protein of unknown function (DUF805)